MVVGSEMPDFGQNDEKESPQKSSQLYDEKRAHLNIVLSFKVHIGH